MNALLIFCIKVLACSGILYGYYRLFLYNKRFHRYNRLYLLASLFLSIVLPLVRIPVLYTPPGQMDGFVYQTIRVISGSHWEDEGPALRGGSGHIDLLNTTSDLYMLYFAGVLIGCWFLLRSLLYIHYLRAAWPGEKVYDLKLYSTRERGTPFSFFRSIFWNEEIPFNSPEGQQVFRHELFHVQQNHSRDILFAEIVTMAGWFNPFFYLMKKELKAVHEFMADEHAVRGKDGYGYAELLIQQVIAARRMQVTHYFFQTHIKRRIAMITQQVHPRTRVWGRVMILPVAALLFCSFAFYAQRAGVSSTPVIYRNAGDPVTVVIDAGHGGMDPGAQSNTRDMREKDVTLQLAKKVEELAPRYNVKVLLTRSDDELPGNSATIADGLHYRTSFAEKAGAGAFVSLHMGAAAEQQQGSGVEIYIPSVNKPVTERSRALGTAIMGTLQKVYRVNGSLMQNNERNIWVLDHAPCPAVLIECGYITNPEDTGFMLLPRNQEQVAKSILEGIVAFTGK